MAFHEKLRAKMITLPKKKKDLLPKGYQIIGSILLIKLDRRLLKHKKLIGKKILEIIPYVKTVALIKEIKKDVRKPKIEVIAGSKNTETVNNEHSCKFLLDVSDIMWSQGNKNEKMRIAKLVKPRETIVDMFAGIGYFSIIIAKHSSIKKIYAIDINPKAIDYLRKNAWLNKVENKIEVLEGDNRRFSKLLESTANRIIMGYLFDTEKFLPYAIKMAKKRAIIHFHRNVKEGREDKIAEKLQKIAEKHGAKLKVIEKKRIKSYAPKIWHMVFDLRITKY